MATLVGLVIFWALAALYCGVRAKYTSRRERRLIEPGAQSRAVARVVERVRTAEVTSSPPELELSGMVRVVPRGTKPSERDPYAGWGPPKGAKMPPQAIPIPEGHPLYRVTPDLRVVPLPEEEAAEGA